ncbi:3-aminomethylindole N-methyltransferase-like isoform X2 [Panicum hallii]|uniref:3-aminomethylindole N-methyltransferase-like isoform X2 n=1 Tax=Panicum hallii TaxID=206008 RepID=UPI000DF4D556|nr:3-aminomethylindole N-methyltransferase-like isoform X2 [Panicum hallii]
MANIAPPPASTLAAYGALDKEDELCLQAQELMLAYNKSLVLRAAIQLGLIDALCAAPAAVTADELAQQIKAVDRANTAASVERILGYLACVNVVRCSAETMGPDGEVLRRYTPAPVCRWLTKNDGKGSLGLFAVFLGDPDHMLPWHHIADAVVSGGPSSFERIQGTPFFDYLGKKNQRLGMLFDDAMADHSVILVTKMLERYRGFDDVRRLVDVGGGTGNTLQMITSRYKHITGINYDLPQGVEHVSGNMYESVPSGDAVLLQWMLLMQTDEQCITILKNCYKALPDGGKVIVIDGIRPEIPDPTSPAARDAFSLDMCMFVLFKGKERTEREFTKLARESGFTGAVRTTYIFLNFYAIEFTK